MSHLRAAAISLVLLTCAVAGCAADPVRQAEVPPAVANRIRGAIELHYPGARVEAVHRSEIAGLFEVYTNDGVIYSDATGDYLLLGNLVDARTRRSLTAERADAHNSIDFAALPFDKAIRMVRGDGSRQLAVFADPDCPYCQKLEQALQGVDDVTISVFLYPLADLHPEAPARARSIWCATDRGEAWSRWMLERVAPPDAACDGDPLAELGELGRRLKVSRTPTLFLQTGRRIAGALTAAELESALATKTAASGGG